MRTGMLKRLILVVTVVGSLGATFDRLAVAPVGAAPARTGAGSGPARAHRRRPPVEEGCRVLPEPAPEAPPAPATCS
jgi:hypothetical protein